MDIGKSFTYMFEDKKWIEKIVIGGLVSLIPIIGNFLVVGYFIELVRRVRQHESEPLPDWDNWGGKLAEGLKLFIIYLVWGLPLIVLYFLAVIPATLVGGNSDTGSTIASLFALCFGCFAFLYGIVLWLVSPAITIKFAETGEIGAGFQIGDILDFTKGHLGEIIVVVLVAMVAYLIAGLVGVLLCLVGLLFTYFWAGLVQYHMMAQIGLEEAEPQRPLETLSSQEIAGELEEPES